MDLSPEGLDIHFTREELEELKRLVTKAKWWAEQIPSETTMYKRFAIQNADKALDLLALKISAG